MNQHSPTPWSLSKDHNHAMIRDAEEYLICDPNDYARRGKYTNANAAFIVTAVNSHDALVEALKGLFEHCAMVHKHWGEGSNQKEADNAIKNANAALKLAEVKP